MDFIPLTEHQRENIKTKYFKEIYFDGEVYQCRVLKDKNGEDILIGGYELEYELHPGEWEDENEGFVSKEAEIVYDKIFSFMDEWDLTFRTDKDLIDELKECSPECFD